MRGWRGGEKSQRAAGRRGRASARRLAASAHPVERRSQGRVELRLSPCTLKFQQAWLFSGASLACGCTFLNSRQVADSNEPAS